MAYDYRDPAIRAKAHAAASLLGEPAASELRAALDALDTAELALVHEIHEHEVSRVALREAIEDLDRVHADAEAAMRGLYDDVEQARDQTDALRAALLEVYRVLSGEEPADDALAALAEYTVDEARHVKRLLAEARGRGVSDTPRIPDMLSRIGQWRDFSIEELDAAFGTVEGEIARLEAELAETRLRLAIWSGEGAPDGWTAAADGVPSIERDIGDLTAEVYADGRWLIWRDLRDGLAPGVVVEDHPGPRPVHTAIAEAEAWLAGQEGGDGR